MERYDIAIIGTGPAGLEAAITAKIRGKKILLLGNADLSTKVEKAHAIDNYLGLPHIAGEDLAAAYQKHLDSMGIEITQDRITAVYAMGDYFALQGAGTPESGMTAYEASAVILATGVVAGKTLPGEEQYLGRGVSYCATCDAALYRGKTAVVIGYGSREEAEAEFLSEVADKVYYVPVYQDEVKLNERIEVVRRKPVGISELKTEQGRKMGVLFEGEEAPSHLADGVFVLREAVSPGQLVPGLETDGSHVVTDRSMACSLPGCFACGDITGTPYQYIKSAGEGNVAALSAAAYLDLKRREQA